MTAAAGHSEWMTAKELAGLPGVPGTDRGLRDMADREQWQWRKRKGRGGGREYHLTSLPPETRAALLARRSLPAAEADQCALIADPARVTDGQRRTAMARAGLCRAIDRMAAEGGMSQTAAARHLSELLALGRADAPIMRMASEALEKPRPGHMPSARTLVLWHGEWRKRGESALIPGKRAKDLQVPAWAGNFLKRYQIPSKPSVDEAYRLFAADCRGNAPSIHQVRRFLAKLSPEAREQGRMGPRELRNIQPHKRRAFKHLAPNDIWTADGHTFDAEIGHPLYPGKVFRPEITTYMDIRTRRIVGWSVDLAESSLAVLDGLRDGISRCGLPAVLYVDNGAGYTSDAVVDVVSRLGITLTHSLPYRSQSRGAIERLQQMWVALAKRLPTYIGADMDKEAGTHVHKITRKALRAGVAHRAIVGWDAFLEMANAAVHDYNARAHSALDHASPDDVWAQCAAEGWGPETVDAEMLDTLCRPQVSRKTHRGEVRLFNRRYFDSNLQHHHGDEVLVGYDLRDAGRVWVHDLSGRLICVAEQDANAADYLPQSRVEEARARREKAQIDRLATKIETRTGQRVAAIQLEHQPGRTLDGVLAPMEIERTAPELQQAARALVDAEPEIDWATDPVGRWQQYQDWSGRADLTDEQRRWVDHYPTTDEYRRSADFYADFAPHKKTAL